MALMIVYTLYPGNKTFPTDQHDYQKIIGLHFKNGQQGLKNMRDILL